MTRMVEYPADSKIGKLLTHVHKEGAVQFDENKCWVEGCNYLAEYEWTVDVGRDDVVILCEKHSNEILAKRKELENETH